MKKMLAVLLVVALALPLMMVGFVNAAEEAESYPGPGVKPAVAYLDGAKQAAFTTPTQVESGKTYVPVRELSELLGLSVSYDAATHTAYILDNANSALATAEKGETMNLYRNDVKLETNVIINAENKSLVAAEDFAAAVGKTYYEDVLSNSLYFFSEDAPMKDGVYTVTGKYSTNRNRIPKIELTVANGVIAAVEYDEYDVESGLGKTNPVYEYGWLEQLSAAIPAYKAQLLETQSPDAVDVITDATQSHDKFVALADKAIAKAQAAKVIEEEIVTLGGEVVDAAYQDGKYVVVGLTASNGWTPQVDMTVEDGKITAITYNAFNADGEGKREDGAGYLTNWTSRYPDVDPVAIITEMERQIVEAQDPNLADVATGATGWGEDLKILATGALYQAKRADIEVTDDATIYVFHGEPTASSAYYVQFLALEKGGEIVDVDYIELQTGSPLAKPHNPNYVSRWATSRADVLNGRDQLVILQDMLDNFMEDKVIEQADTLTGATNWGKGVLKLAPKAVEVIEGK